MKAYHELIPLYFRFHQFLNGITLNEFTETNVDPLLMIWTTKGKLE